MIEGALLLTIEQAAATLAVSPRTVRRQREEAADTLTDAKREIEQ